MTGPALDGSPSQSVSPIMQSAADCTPTYSVSSVMLYAYDTLPMSNPVGFPSPHVINGRASMNVCMFGVSLGKSAVTFPVNTMAQHTPCCSLHASSSRITKWGNNCMEEIG
jgi:hypothetical protein